MVRSIAWWSVHFQPSNQIGSGRYLEGAGLVPRFDEVKGCLLSDVVVPSVASFFGLPVNNEWRRRDDSVPVQ